MYPSYDSVSSGGGGGGGSGGGGGGISLTNGVDNRVITATGAGAANAEANLTFDGSTLIATGVVSASGIIYADDDIQTRDRGNNSSTRLNITDDTGELKVAKDGSVATDLLFARGNVHQP